MLVHTNTSVSNRKRIFSLVARDANLELWLGVEKAGFTKCKETDLVERIRRIADKLAKENILLGV